MPAKTKATPKPGTFAFYAALQSFAQTPLLANPADIYARQYDTLSINAYCDHRCKKPYKVALDLTESYAHGLTEARQQELMSRWDANRKSVDSTPDLTCLCNSRLSERLWCLTLKPVKPQNGGWQDLG